MDENDSHRYEGVETAETSQSDETPAEVRLRANAAASYIAYMIGAFTVMTSWFALLEILPGRDPLYLALGIAIVIGSVAAIATRRLLLGAAK